LIFLGLADPFFASKLASQAPRSLLVNYYVLVFTIHIEILFNYSQNNFHPDKRKEAEEKAGSKE
jgi:hypothetical protein